MEVNNNRIDNDKTIENNTKENINEKVDLKDNENNINSNKIKTNDNTNSSFKKTLEEIKLSYIKLSGLNVSDCQYYDIYVDENEYLSMLIIDVDESIKKPDLIMIHGLTGTSLYYFKIFKRLSKHFRIVCIDLPGMGISNRVSFDYRLFDIHNSEKYFISKIKYVLDLLDIKKANFVSHSFGGYITGLFAINYSHMIESIILISPVGVTSCYMEIISSKSEDRIQKLMYFLGYPPSKAFKIIPFSGGILEKMISNNVKKLENDDEQDLVKQTIKYILNLPATSEHLIFNLFNWKLQAFKPLIYYFEILEKLKIDFIYGDEDWNPSDHAEDVSIY